jgi:hypothetical protein
MSNAALDINIKANADQVLAAIRKIQGSLDILKDKINSLPEGDKQIGSLSRQFTKLSVAQKKLIDDFDKLSTEIPATNSKFEQTADVTKRARNAFTSMNLVVQDLPFGFIAIQNNLPNLIQNFSLLASEIKKGPLPSFKELYTNLAGPAAFLVFSGAIALVTKLTKEYGSLGAAIKAIVNGNQELVKAQVIYNKELAASTGNTATEAEKIKILTGIISNLKLPLKDRQAAYEQLKKIQPEVVDGIDKENISLADSIKIIEANAKARLQLIALKAREAAVTTTINQNAAKQQELEIARKPLLESLIKAQKLYDLGVQSGIVQSQKRYVTLSQEEIQLYAARKALTDNINAYNALVPVQDEYLNKLKPIVTEISKLEFGTNNLNGSLNEHNKKVKEGAEYVHEFSKAYMDWTNRLWNAPIIEAARNLAAWRFVLTKVAQSTEDARMANDKLEPSIQGVIDAGYQQIKMQTEMGTGLQQFTQNTSDDTGKAIKSFISNIKTIYPIMQSTFVAPLEDAFKSFLDTGKFAFKEFTKAVLDSIKQIVAKLAATGIVASLAILLSGGFAAGTGVAGLKTLGAALLSSVGANTGGQLGLRPIANPSFGGIGAGPMAMSGSVNLTLRGTDLIGSINRTNTNINRIG